MESIISWQKNLEQRGYNEEEQNKHKKIIYEILCAINTETNLCVLKGGTGLMACYDLDRFSEDIDFDSVSKCNIEEILEDFCKKKKFKLNKKKDTLTTKRFMITYGNKTKEHLKIDISYRNKDINTSNIIKINKILVYNINEMLNKKCLAYFGRDKIRDLYDILFIADKYWNNLKEGSKEILFTVLSEKGIDYFDYITSTQKDPLINISDLAERFLYICEKIGMFIEDDEKAEITKNVSLKTNITEMAKKPNSHKLRF